MMPPNRSSRFIDWCEVSPCLFSSSRMSSMIVFSVSVGGTVQEKPSQESWHGDSCGEIRACWRRWLPRWTCPLEHEPSKTPEFAAGWDDRRGELRCPVIMWGVHFEIMSSPSLSGVLKPPSFPFSEWAYCNRVRKPRVPGQAPGSPHIRARWASALFERPQRARGAAPDPQT
jgi:hypothetical protein